jgi:hypothetical protein
MIRREQLSEFQAAAKFPHTAFGISGGTLLKFSTKILKILFNLGENSKIV